jgi:phytanoyl-CoA hydroxylase
LSPNFIDGTNVNENGSIGGFYRENGYVVVPDALGRAEIDELIAETLLICRGERGEINRLQPSVPEEEDAEVLKRTLCVHFPHKISAVMRRYLAHPNMVKVLTEIIGLNVKAMQSMLFIKASGKPGQAWHQDEAFIPTRDRSLTGGWIALDDATVESGCLWVIPGSHKLGTLWPTQVQNDDRFDCTAESTGFPYSDSDAIPVQVKAGAIVFFNGYLLHRSFPNKSHGNYRRVLVNHYMNAASLLPWQKPQEEEGMGSLDYRDIVMVSGKDPYAWKGTKNIAEPSVRPSGEGGCEKWGSKE